MTKKEIVFDIEANGLNPDKIWCIVAKPINEPAIEFGPNKLKEGLEYLDSADTLIGHNILGFDFILETNESYFDIVIYQDNTILNIYETNKNDLNESHGVLLPCSRQTF